MLDKGYLDCFEEGGRNTFDNYINLVISAHDGLDGILLKEIVKNTYRYKMNTEAELLATCEDKINEIGSLYYNYLRELIVSIVRLNLTEDEFYEKLFGATFNSNLLPNDNESMGIILCFICTQYEEIPYCQPRNLIKMTEEKYRETLDKVEPNVNKARYALSRQFNSRTEEASQLIDAASNLTDINDLAVFVSAVLSLIRDENDNNAESE